MGFGVEFKKKKKKTLVWLRCVRVSANKLYKVDSRECEDELGLIINNL